MDTFEIIVFCVLYAHANTSTYKLFVVPCMTLILKFQFENLYLLCFHKADLVVKKILPLLTWSLQNRRHQNVLFSQEALHIPTGFGVLRKKKEKEEQTCLLVCFFSSVTLSCTPYVDASGILGSQ